MLSRLGRRASARRRTKHVQEAALAGQFKTSFALFTGARDPGETVIGGSGHALCRGLDLYFDGSTAEIAGSATDGGPFCLSIGAFDGSYLSLVASVPKPQAMQIGLAQTLEVDIAFDVDRPLAAYLRMNIRTTDGAETLYETLVLDQGPRRAVFDTDGILTPLGGRMSAWVDIIFPDPAHAVLTMHGLTITMRPKGL